MNFVISEFRVLGFRGFETYALVLWLFVVLSPWNFAVLEC